MSLNNYIWWVGWRSVVNLMDPLLSIKIDTAKGRFTYYLWKISMSNLLICIKSNITQHDYLSLPMKTFRDVKNSKKTSIYQMFIKRLRLYVRNENILCLNKPSNSKMIWRQIEVKNRKWIRYVVSNFFWKSKDRGIFLKKCTREKYFIFVIQDVAGLLRT